ncbi:MAG TPA: hypothetical protein VMZ53_04920 [Kofleriaceae bacterium]|nr:hypothetical protein [Kofleriaceae bacterium]
MYRDSANALDERDRAVGAILVGEALVDEIKRAHEQIAASDSPLSHRERWRTITSVHDTYPHVWQHLDRAREVLAKRGANTLRYDELRPQAKRAPTNAEGSIDIAALDDVRRAIEDLKLAVPGADWKAINSRTQGLIHAKLSRPRGQRAIVTAALAMFLFGVVAWAIAIMPEHKVNRREAMRRELSQIQQIRKVKIDVTRVELGARCDVDRARELTKLLAMDGRTEEARTFGATYMLRCGDDSVVDNWAHAPHPNH